MRKTRTTNRLFAAAALAALLAAPSARAAEDRSKDVPTAPAAGQAAQDLAPKRAKPHVVAGRQPFTYARTKEGEARLKRKEAHKARLKKRHYTRQTNQ